MNQPCDLPDPDLVLLALWHAAVRSAVSVHALVGWKANIRGMRGWSDETARTIGQERGWEDSPDFMEWRSLRHHIEHVVKWETVSFPIRYALPMVDPAKGVPKAYIGDGDEYNFKSVPDANAIKRFEQFLYGLGNAVDDWYRKAREKADEEAEEWFKPEEIEKRRSRHIPFSVSDRFTHCPPRQVEKWLTGLTRDVSLGRASSRYMAGYRYEIMKTIRESGALMARFKLDHLNADLSSGELALSRWSRYVEARLEALDVWMKEAGGGSPSKVMRYTPDRDRYFDILADVCAKHRVRP